MSDKDFDEDLLEEYDTETGQIIESKKERKGSLMKGLAFGLILTVVLELGVGLALDASGNLVHRYLAYMLGLVPILVASFMTRSMVKMALVGAPVLVVASFALPFFLPTVFTGLMTPFLTLIPIINELARIGDTLGVETGAEAIIGPVNQYGIALDFLFGIIVGIFAAMGLAGIARVFTRKFGIFTIFTFIFSMVFIVIGVIVLPYLLVVTSGIAQFGMTFATGGALLGAGTQITATPDGDLDLANQYFSEAEQWFIEAEKTLAGLEALGVFGLIGSANPDVAAIVNNGLALVNAGVDLAKGIAPALAGFGAITQGMEIALESFDTGGGLMLSQATFDEGIDLVEQGFANFTQSIDSIKEAIVTIQEDVDRDELVAALERQGAGDVGPQIDFVFFGLPLLEIALDVFTNDAGTGLIDDPDGIEVDTERSPIVHLLLGAQSMTSVGDQIGQDSDFSGTAGLFNDLIFHLQFVVDALDPAVNLPMGELNDFVLDANAPPELVELKDQIVGTTNFLKDAGDTTIAIGEFGLIASPTLVSMNTTMFFLTDAEDFTTLPGSQFDAAIEGFDGTPTQVGIVGNASLMQARAGAVRAQIDNMEFGVGNETYGFFNEPAGEFVTQFREFNLLQNANNFFHISSGLSALLKTMKVMTTVDSKLALVEGNVTVVQTEIGFAQANISAANVPAAQASITAAEAAVVDVKTDLVLANTTLQTAKVNLFNASSNFNATQDMPQLEATGQALGRIGVRMQNIQVGNGTYGGLTQTTVLIDNIETSVGTIETLVADDPVTNAVAIQAEFDSITADLDDITLELAFMQDQFALIQTDLADVSVDA